MTASTPSEDIILQQCHCCGQESERSLVFARSRSTDPCCSRDSFQIFAICAAEAALMSASSVGTAAMCDGGKQRATAA